MVTFLNGKAPYKIACRWTWTDFQNIRLFKDLTVLDNVLIAFGNHHKQHVFASLLRFCQAFTRVKEFERLKPLNCLTIFGLEGDAETLAKKLSLRTTTSLGDRSCPCYRSLKSSSLDEPAAGMNPLKKQQN